MLEVIESCRYEANGVYYSDRDDAPSPIEWVGQVSRAGNSLSMEGKYRRRIGDKEHPFWLELALSASAADFGTFHLHCVHLNDATGSFRHLGGSTLFGGRAAGVGATVSLGIQCRAPAVLDGRGALVFADGSTWLYHFEAAPTRAHVVKADVVNLRRHG